MNMDIVIPDLRYEEGFRAKLLSNARLSQKQKNKKNGLTEENIENKDEFPPITLSIIISTIIQDQIIMPLVQGFLISTVLVFLRPLIGSASASGRYYGSMFINKIKSVSSVIFNIKPKPKQL